MGKQWKQCQTLFSGAPKSLQMVIATMKLKDGYAGEEATVRTGHGRTDWFQIGKGVRQGCMLSPCLLTSM